MSTLHITNGGCAADPLRTFLRDPVLTTCDPLHDGPAPRVDSDAWHRLRAQHLTGGPRDGLEREACARCDERDERPDSGPSRAKRGERTEQPTEADKGSKAASVGSFEETRRDLETVDRTIADAARFDEVVLWFEHDLFDQLQVIRNLDLLASVPRNRVSMICIDRFPGVEPFYGLGQLSADQLSTLTGTRREVTLDQFALATRAWNAFRAPDPAELIAFASALRDNAEVGALLPFLGDALWRFFEEYPSAANGLSRTEHAVLRAVDGGARDRVEVFRRSQAEEERPFLGDLGVFDIVHQFATARVPLLSAPADDGISLTAAGRDVLSGRADAVALNGIDVWRGGVHLLGRDRSPWRWDAQRQTLVSCM